jgi:hypothetical protein
MYLYIKIKDFDKYPISPDSYRIECRNNWINANWDYRSEGPAFEIGYLADVLEPPTNIVHDDGKTVCRKTRK